MKKLIFSLAAAGLFATQLSAQVSVAASQAPEAPRTTARAEAPAETVTRVNSYEGRSQDNYDGPKRTKTFTKTFALDNSDKVSLSNQYGSITIKTWDKKEIKADIVMEAYSDSEKEVQKLIDDVNIEAGKSGDLVSFKTILSKGNFGKNISNGKVRWRREVKVNYTIYMPATNPLNASMQYGNINMENFSAATSLKVQYGDIIAGNLSSSNNYLAVQYGSLKVNSAENASLNIQYAGANINTIKGNADIKAQYGNGLIIGSVDNIKLDAQYTTVKLTTVNGNADIEQQYNSLSIGSVGKLNVNSEYTSVSIGTLKGDGNLKMSYNKLNINEITAACKNLTVRNEYSGVSLGFGSGYNASFEVEVEYAGFRSGSNVTAHQVKDNDDDYDSKKSYTGKIGNGGTAMVKVRSQYGDVSFK